MPGPAKSTVQKSVTIEQPQVRFTDKPMVSLNEIKLKTGFSLNEIKTGAIQKSVVNTELIETSASKDNLELTAEHIKKVLDEFAEVKQQQGAKQLFITLTKAEITYQNQLATIIIGNETQREQLVNMKQDLVDELRKKLRNNSIALEIAITQTQTQTKAYKPSDVFKSMAEKNPAMFELKKRFDLEIDY